jgi:hypothetical protein
MGSFCIAATFEESRHLMMLYASQGVELPEHKVALLLEMQKQHRSKESHLYEHPEVTPKLTTSMRSPQKAANSFFTNVD